MQRSAPILLAAILTCAALCLAQPATPHTTPDFRTFRPSADGFAFVNHFEGTPLPGALGALASLGRSAGAPTVFGLCGGMSFAAADFYLADKPIPARSDIPVRGDALFDYLQQRQLATFGPDMKLAARFGRWMSLPDDGLFGTRMLSAREIGRACRAIERGDPIVLGLVYNRYATNTRARAPVGVPWENHQVLVYDIAPRQPDTEAPIDLRIYDPNYPKNDAVVIRARPTIVGSATVGPWGAVPALLLGDACERVVPEHRPTRVRGVFVMPYEPETPPHNLD